MTFNFFQKLFNKIGFLSTKKSNTLYTFIFRIFRILLFLTKSLDKSNSKTLSCYFGILFYG